MYEKRKEKSRFDEFMKIDVKCCGFNNLHKSSSNRL